DQNSSENDHTFRYTYIAPTEEERREIESIRRSYVNEEEGDSKLDQLRALDSRVKKPALWVALILGILGLLSFGLGMSMVLEWRMFLGGVIVSLAGTALMVLAYPANEAILRRNKAKYRDRILKLSEELLHKDESRK
ncbi:MAG: hypothetical protein ACI4WV_05760, partial [Eubacteriales bacterium]